jgi:hypothetical protein
VLRRRGLPYLRDCDPMTGAVIKASKSTAVRYEHDHPGRPWALKYPERPETPAEIESDVVEYLRQQYQV